MFENVTLELSLKPFKQTDEAYIRRVCAQIFEQWRALLKNRKSVSVMLWVGDGSEILDYAGEMEEEFEWARFIGTANLPHLEDGAPRETSLHKRKQDYMKDPPQMTYGVLKEIVSTLKEVGKEYFPDTIIRVGETFDIGPEFAISDFKYNRHAEICLGSKLDKHGFVDATATLHADDRYYAAYPNGIPEGTPFGTFLGRQSDIFLRDMGFDYLWLSNGLGFSANPWDNTGKIFDGEKYRPEKLADTKQKVFEFWKLFFGECSFPVETRGTNNSVGIDYASDGVPLYDIYNAGWDIVAPPNSPWAALNDNFGLEIMGHMSRVCELPSEKFPFRFYIHDPWWVNSPWFDRYDNAPHDIYLPMAISRINSEGRVESANSLNILSIDNSYGDMPDQCVNEPLPHLLKAEKDLADEPAPLVWVYPMKEYTTATDASLLREMNICDNLIANAINDGLPLCCVVSTDNFLQHDFNIYRRSVLISPVPENAEVLEKLLLFAKRGIGVIFYGTARSLQLVPKAEGILKIDAQDEASKLREALSAFGYEISFDKKSSHGKPPAMMISRSNNAMFFSAYNPNTTTDSRLKFPFGAPILCGCEAEISGGCSSYRFSRSEHRECRVFVEQNSGVVSCREAPPVNARYRRAIKITGLEDATVRLFPEKGCESAVSLAKSTSVTPEIDVRFSIVQDEKYGTYLEGRHISGNIYFLIGHKH